MYIYFVFSLGWWGLLGGAILAATGRWILYLILTVLEVFRLVEVLGYMGILVTWLTDGIDVVFRGHGIVWVCQSISQDNL